MIAAATRVIESSAQQPHRERSESFWHAYSPCADSKVGADSVEAGTYSSMPLHFSRVTIANLDSRRICDGEYRPDELEEWYATGRVAQEKGGSSRGAEGEGG